jgi:hypothetical protein
MSKKSKNDKKSKSTLDSDTKHSGVNGQLKIGKKEYEAEIFKIGRPLLGCPTKPLRKQIGTWEEVPMRGGINSSGG